MAGPSLLPLPLYWIPSPRSQSHQVFSLSFPTFLCCSAPPYIYCTSTPRPTFFASSPHLLYRHASISIANRHKMGKGEVEKVYYNRQRRGCRKQRERSFFIQLSTTHDFFGERKGPPEVVFQIRTSFLMRELSFLFLLRQFSPSSSSSLFRAI